MFSRPIPGSMRKPSKQYPEKKVYRKSVQKSYPNGLILTVPLLGGCGLSFCQAPLSVQGCSRLERPQKTQARSNTVPPSFMQQRNKSTLWRIPRSVYAFSFVAIQPCWLRSWPLFCTTRARCGLSRSSALPPSWSHFFAVRFTFRAKTYHGPETRGGRFQQRIPSYSKNVC